MVNKYIDLRRTFNENYKGPLLGVCIQCGGLPKAQQSKYIRSYIVKCTRCSNRTIDYCSLDYAIQAWNRRNTLSFDEEVKRTKERR